MRLLCALSFAILTSCATNFQPQPLPADHPASAQAPEAPRIGLRQLLASDELTRKTKAQLARNGVPNPDFESGGMSHDMGNMKGMDHSQMKGMDHSKMPGMQMSKPPAGAPSPKPESMPGMDHSQMEMKKTPEESKKNSDKAKPAPAPTIYTCVMHPEVQQATPGNCPKCGMTLVKKEPATP